MDKKVRQLAARRMVAQKLETMAGEADDLAVDLQAFPIASSHLDFAAESLRKAVQCLVGPVDRTTLTRPTVQIKHRKKT
jgi:hypothetical protein